MRNLHTLTFNEETWTICRGIKSDIYQDGLPTLWYLEMEGEKTLDGFVDIIGFKLKNMNDGKDNPVVYCTVKDLTFESVVEIIKVIKSKR